MRAGLRRSSKRPVAVQKTIVLRCPFVGIGHNRCRPSTSGSKRRRRGPQRLSCGSLRSQLPGTAGNRREQPTTSPNVSRRLPHVPDCARTMNLSGRQRLEHVGAGRLDPRGRFRGRRRLMKGRRAPRLHRLAGRADTDQGERVRPTHTRWQSSRRARDRRSRNRAGVSSRAPRATITSAATSPTTPPIQKPLRKKRANGSLASRPWK
jgi:hypothetical protein